MPAKPIDGQSSDRPCASSGSLGRRTLLAAGPLLALARPARAEDIAPDVPLRALGNPKAALVQEWFSLTCTHCARFSNEVFPTIKAKMIDTGKVYYVFRDFPLDRVALLAAAVSRALPADRYLPFIEALFASQDRWAFAEGVDSKAVLRQMAGLAGMPPATFDAVAADQARQKAIIAEQDAGQKKYNIQATPTFVFGTTAHAGELTPDDFAAMVSKDG